MSISRRDFLSLGSISVAGAVTGCNNDDGLNEAVLAKKFDVCVIGSGFAGIPLAQRTCSNRLHTVVIEAGGALGLTDRLFARRKQSFEVINTGSVNYPAEALRVIGLGGTSNHWGGVTTRLRPEDFKMRSLYGFSDDWPIGYEDLESYFCQAEEYLQVRGYPAKAPHTPPASCSNPVEIAAPETLPEFQIENELRALYPFGRSRRNPDDMNSGPVRLADREIPELLNSPYATIVTNHQIFDVVTLDGQTIDHVLARNDSGTVVKIFARQFVIANGAIESPRLLLQSTSVWYPNGLGNQHDLVGRHFNVHASLDTRFTTGENHNLPLGEYRYHGLIDAYRSQGLNGVHFQADIESENSIRWRIQPEFEPQRENRVTIARTRQDPWGLPLPELNLSYSERDRATIARCQAFRNETKEAFGLDKESGNNFSFFRGHPAGACRMGFTERDGVVDANNKVFGLDNLYVSSASTFTTSGTSNPTGPLVALTLRLADHLVANYQRDS